MKYSQNSNLQNENEYTYVNGYGFTYNAPQFREKALIKSYANAAAISIISIFLLKLLLSPIIKNSIMFFLQLIPVLSNLRNNQILVSYISDILVYFFALMLPFFFYAKTLKIPMSVAFPINAPDNKKFFPVVAFSMGVSVIGIITSIIFALLLNIFGFSFSAEAVYPPKDIVELLIFITKSVFLAAVTEEFVFRGAVLQSLRRFGDGFAIIVSSIIFAAVHANFVQAPTAFLMGITLSFAVIITRSIWTGVTIHILHNGFLVILTVLEPYLSDNAYYLLIIGTFLFLLLISILGIIILAKNFNYLFELKPTKTIYKTSEKITIYLTTISMIITMLMLFSMCMQSVQYLG
ncbi:MAG: type II CAAX endopeptidase family protein [Oscillospiraceae bacterium]